MPTLHKIDEAVFNVKTAPVKMTKNCLPVIQVLNGRKTQVTDEYGTLVARGRYEHLVFVPNAMLGEVRWTRVFNRQRKTNYDQVVVDTGVIFLFNPITA